MATSLPNVRAALPSRSAVHKPKGACILLSDLQIEQTLLLAELSTKKWRRKSKSGELLLDPDPDLPRQGLHSYAFVVFALKCSEPVFSHLSGLELEIILAFCLDQNIALGYSWHM